MQQEKWLEDWNGRGSYKQVKKLCLEGTEKLWKNFNDISLPLASQPIIYLDRPFYLQGQRCYADNCRILSD